MGVTLGSGVYRDTVAASEENDVRRTALSYLVNQVRRAQRVEVGSFVSVPALDLADQDAPEYHTVLYVYEGQLESSMQKRAAASRRRTGIPILPLEGMELTLEEELLTIAVTAEAGGTSSVSISPRMGRGAGPRRGGAGMRYGAKKADLFLLEAGVQSVPLCGVRHGVRGPSEVHARSLSRESASNSTQQCLYRPGHSGALPLRTDHL